MLKLGRVNSFQLRLLTTSRLSGARGGGQRRADDESAKSTRRSKGSWDCFFFLNLIGILTRLKSEFSGTYSLVINQKPVESKKSTFDLANRCFT